MRNRILPAIPAALLIVLGAAAPAFAGGGLPVLSTLKAGHAEVTIYGDSLFVHTGTNTLTLEATDLPEGATPTLRLTGPDGQVVPVALSPLHVVGGPADAHGGHGDSHEAPAAPAAPATDAHGAGHGAAPAAPAADAHSASGHEAAPAAPAVWFRGQAKVPATGYWKAELVVNGAKATDDLKVVNNGPSPLYLAVTGVTMGGTMLYGAMKRRREGMGVQKW